MKVLQIINSLQVGGAEVLVRNLIEPLKRQGVDTTLYVLKASDSPLERELLAGNADIRFSRLSSLYSPWHVPELAQHLCRERYDRVHVHLFPAQLWAALARRLAGTRVPLLTTEHSTHNRRRKPWFRPLDRWMYAQYQAIASIGETTSAALIGWLPELADKVQLVPNGIPLQRFQAAVPLPKEQIIGQANAPVILFVARFDEQKDHATLLRAVAHLSGVHAVLVGDGPNRPAMETLAQSLGVAERVHFVGQRQDVPALLKMADLYVQASHWEGFGLAVVEAMAAGLPVIASRVPGLMDVVGEAGLLFAPGNHEDLARHIQTVLQHPEARNTLRARARDRAALFTIERCAEGYATLFKTRESRY